MPPDSEHCNGKNKGEQHHVLLRCCCGGMNPNNVHIYLSLFCNFVFAVLFIAVFVMLGDMKAKYDQAVQEINSLVQHLPVPTQHSQGLKPYQRDTLYRIQDISNGTFYAELGNRTEEIIRKVNVVVVHMAGCSGQPIECSYFTGVVCDRCASQSPVMNGLFWCDTWSFSIQRMSAHLH